MKVFDMTKEERIGLVASAQAEVDRAEVVLNASKKARNEIFESVHGEQADGFLSYKDITDAMGSDSLSKGRVIQIIQTTRKKKEGGRYKR